MLFVKINVNLVLIQFGAAYGNSEASLRLQKSFYSDKILIHAYANQYQELCYTFA